MRILFYLPVMTDAWFIRAVAPMLRILHDRAELHVVAPTAWNHTGIHAGLLAPLVDLERVHWHIVTPEDPRQFRVDGKAIPQLLDLVASINPDLTIARSADQATPLLFPGTVRFMMEAAAPPFPIDPRAIILEERLFAHGALPAGVEQAGAACAAMLAGLWRRAEAEMALEPSQGWREAFGLPHGRPILAVPLQCEFRENFFLAPAAFPRGADLVAHLLETLDEDVFLAITDHPLNRRMGVDRRPIDALIAAHPHRARLCAADALPHGATGLFAAHADAMLIDQSKSWSLAAFRGTPILRVGSSPMADWIAASDDVAGFPRGLRRPDPAAMRSWFGWHMGARVLDPTRFTLDALMARVENQIDHGVIEANLRKMLGDAPRRAA